MSKSQLEQLKDFTVVVADTGDFEQIAQYRPRDATTNPSLILKAAGKDDYKPLLEKAVANAKNSPLAGDALLGDTMDKLLVLFGLEILKLVPGRVSTEVDAHLSFDTPATIARARKIIADYESHGIGRERVLIKIASTWEGIRAAETLTAEGIHCNLTLLFSMPQAVACAEAGVQLISPFVGRILDWHKAHDGRDFTPQEDPGVQSVHEIYTYFKKFGYKTEIMGASFRNSGEVLELAGCDLLTISPELLDELSKSTDPVVCKLTPADAANANIERLQYDEKAFRFAFNDNAMATEKTAEGIRKFAADIVTLKAMLAKMLG